MKDLIDSRNSQKNYLESENLKTAFLQNISHEIRTPLNGIIGFSELLGEEGLTREEIRKFVAIICENGNKLIEIVSNILEISKIQTGQTNMRINPVEVNSLFSDLITEFGPLMVSKNIILKHHNPADQNITINSDNDLLHQILRRLINNALKFTKSGSIDFGYTNESNEVRFYVRDTGIGIAQKNIYKVFERFYQAEQVFSNIHEGTGLGLAICKGLVELLGGRIWVESEPGLGTTVFFTVPVSEQIPQNEISDLEKQEKTLPSKILVAEDDWVNFLYLKMFLEDAGIEVIHAKNGLEAVDLVKQYDDIDLILMDISMPVMDGIEAAKIIKKLNPALNIIAHTTRVSDKGLNNNTPFGCDDYLSKPFKTDQLNTILTKFLH